jgi:hypothetical protein
LIKIKKTKLVSKILVISLFLVSIIALVTPALANKSNRMFILANGDDLDILGAKTIIIGSIEFGDAPSGQFHFQTKIYDDLGNIIYVIKGKLKDGVATPLPEWFCNVRKVLWVNLWLVMGKGMIKTTNTFLDIEYRGETITLPNTEGKWIPWDIVMLLSPNGEIYIPDGENLYLGGWAFAGILGYIGGVTALKKLV